MPTSVRKDGKAKKVVLDLLGEPAGGNTDSQGKKKKFKKSKTAIKEDRIKGK